MPLRFQTEVKSKRIPIIADEKSSETLLASQDMALKNTDSLSQPSCIDLTESEPLSAASTAYFSHQEGSATKRLKLFHPPKESIESNCITPSTIKHPSFRSTALIDCVRTHLDNFPLERQQQTLMVRRFLYQLAEIYFLPTLKAIVNKPGALRLKKTATNPEKITKRITKSLASQKRFLNNLIRDAIAASYHLGDQKAARTIEKYINKNPKFKTPSQDPLFNDNEASLTPALLQFMATLSSNLENYYSTDTANAMIDIMLPIINSNLITLKATFSTAQPTAGLRLKR